MTNQGNLFHYEITIGCKKRKMLMYVPEDVMASTSGVFLLPPSGVTAEEFLENSDWEYLCDTEERKEKMVIFVLEAENGGLWDVNEAYQTADGEITYLMKAYEKATDFSEVCIHEAKRYVVGYGEGAAIAQMFAMWYPAPLAGIAAVNPVPVDPEYMRKAGSDLCTVFHGFIDPEARKGIRKGDIPIPAWILSTTDMRYSAEADYWRHANSADPEEQLADRNVYAWVRKKETDFPKAQEKEAQRVWVSQIREKDGRFGGHWNRKIWKDFLSQTRKWMSEAGGSLRLTKDPVRDLGMTYRREEVEGIEREWYIHVPRQVKKEPEKAVPLVFAYHGYSCSGEIYVGSSGWDQVADRYGFIVIYPSGINTKLDTGLENPYESEMKAWPGWDHLTDAGRESDMAFFRYMLKDAKEKYCIDPSRIYVSGQSNGSVMTQYIGLTQPELVTAISPVSGIIHMAGGEKILDYPETRNREKVDLPVWMFGCECEQWLLDYRPESGNRTSKSIEAWWSLNRMPGDLSADYEKDEIVHDRWHDWCYRKDGVPMIRWTGVEYMPHGVTPDMSWRTWEEFFSKIRRREDGTIEYQE